MATHTSLRESFHAFEPNAIVRGAQLTLVGAHRALQNPRIFKSDHYKHAALAILAGIAIHIILYIPIVLAKFSLVTISLFSDLDRVSWDDEITNGLHYFQHSVLQIPFVLMSLLKHISPALDEMFMESLDWVDRTYSSKHQSEDPSHLREMYYPNLKQYNIHMKTPAKRGEKKTFKDGAIAIGRRYAKRGGISLAVFLCSYIPYVGNLVLPAASFYTFRKAVGPKPAIAIFALGLIVPKHFFVRFLQTYFSSRTLMRELLEPYFSRIRFTTEQKRKWFRDREGVLFGFGVGFFLLIKIPLVGVLIYGIAEASTAYLITKITDPPPPPTGQVEEFAESQARWRNRTAILSKPLFHLDWDDRPQAEKEAGPEVLSTGATQMPRRKFA